MRPIKYLFLLVVLLALVVVALANEAVVTVNVLPADLAAWVGWSFSIDLPLFVVIFASIVVGLVLGFVWEWLREHRFRSEASKERRERTKLQREVDKLKGKANEGKDEVLALLEDGGRTG